MCGIAGIMTRDTPPDRQLLKRMLETLRHRGPDDSGIYCEGNVGLAQSRLSIIDLAHGHQPLTAAPLALVANGEIYNHVELRQALLSRGRRFSTQSDSETILHAYADAPQNFVQTLHGMFAFALHDASKRTLTLARDRLGIKPLFYHLDGSRLTFASEIKALLAALPTAPDIDPAALHQYLQNQFSTGRSTIFHGIKRVLPGEIITFDRHLNAKHQRYWQATDIRPREIDFETATEEFDSLFEIVMREHMRADVPFGLFLSGGTDSAILAAMLTRLHGHRLSSWSIGFRGVKMKDELNDAERIAKQFGTDHHAIQLDANDIFQRIPYSIWCADDLMRDYANMPTSILAERAGAELKVVFSGEGGDEVFAGYRRYRPSIEQKLKNWLYPGSGGFRTRGHWHGRWASRVFGDRLKASAEAMRAAFIEAWQATPHDWSDIQRRQYVDLTTALPDNLLVKADRMLMGFSLEGRVPFLDHRIVEFGLGLPDDLKIRDKQGKWFLKQWASRFLPADHLWQKKRGFHVPIDEWLRGDAFEQIATALLNNDAIGTWFDRKGLTRMFESHRRNHRLSREIFSILQFAIWHRIFIEGNGEAPPPNADPIAWL